MLLPGAISRTPEAGAKGGGGGGVFHRRALKDSRKAIHEDGRCPK